MNEAGFIRKVHNKLPKRIYRAKFADRFTSGLPDCWYSGRKGDLWIEYKYHPKATYKPNLSKHQIHWLRGRHSEGRKVAVVVGSPSGVVIHQGTDWEKYVNASVVDFETFITWIIDTVDETNNNLLQ